MIFTGENNPTKSCEDRNIVQEDEILVCNSCNFKGKNRKSISVHWIWNPDCKKGDYTKETTIHDKKEPELKRNVSLVSYKCDACNFETKYSQNLTAHFKSLKHIILVNINQNSFLSVLSKKFVKSTFQVWHYFCIIQKFS